MSEHESSAELRWLALVVLLALVSRISVALLTRSWAFPEADHHWAYGYEMGQIGASVAMGGGFAWPSWSLYPPGPTAWMPPLYPAVIALAFAAFGIYTQSAAAALLSFQVVASVLTCVLLYALGKQIVNGWSGLLAALMLALYPPSIHFAAQKIWSTSLFALLVLLLIWWLVRLSRRPSGREGVALGVLLGCTLLLDPIILAATPFVVVWFLFHADGERGRVLRAAAAILVACGLTISPWIARNHAVFGGWTLVKSNLGHELLAGNNEYATGGYEDYAKVWENLDAILPAGEREAVSWQNEVVRNNLLARRAVEYVLAHPIRFARLSATRFVRFWTLINPVTGWAERIALFGYLGVLALAVPGLFLCDPRRRGTQILLVFLLSLPLPYYFTVVANHRYRFPVEPILILFAAHAVQRLARRWGITAGR